MISKLLWLAMVCCLASFARAAAANGTVEVPFDFYRNAIMVRAKVNGKGPFNLLLDTGVNPSVVDRGTAREIGLKVAATGHQGTGGGNDINLTYATRLPSVELGGLAARNIDALAADLSKSSAALGRRIDGVLGYSLLRGRVVQIDYPRRVVRFYAHSPFAKTAGVTTLSFRYRDDILIDGVSVNGKRMLANLDTGSNNTFQLTPAAVAEAGLEKEASQGRGSRSVGINGVTENRQGRVGNITIGGISVDGPSVVFYGKHTGHDNEAWGIRIGNAFLKDFVVTVDYQRGVVTLQRPGAHLG